MNTIRAIDTEAALADPAQIFGEPEEVVSCRALSTEMKIRILRQWEIDARLLAVAEEENMAGGEASKLGRVVRALIELNDERKLPEHESTAAHKSGG